MKSRPAKIAHLALALLLAVAWAPPACAGGEGCSMPCCRSKASAPAHAAMPCCAQPEKTGCDVDSGCTVVNSRVLQTVLPDVRPAGVAIALAPVLSTPVLPTTLPAVPPARSGPPFDTPLYLLTLSLLI